MRKEFSMRVIIKDEFYEFQNERTESLFVEQKKYLTDLIQKFEAKEDMEGLLTTLFSLNNLSEALIDEMVTQNGLDNTITKLNAFSVAE